MTVSRRLFVAGGAAAAAAGALAIGLREPLLGLEPTSEPNADIEFSHPLYIPELLEPRNAGGTKVYELTAASGESSFLPGLMTATAGYNGAYLGPTIRAVRGDTVRLVVRNRLGEPTTVHWHGMELPAVMDGGPHQVIQPGGEWRPEWIIQNNAATLWYHSHLLGRTGPQVYHGLAGLFLIDDAAAPAGLPATYGVDDIPLIVQDRVFGERGEFIYRHDETAFVTAGMLGDTILVNGTIGPVLLVQAGLVRLRILNASNARRYNFAFSDGRSFVQIASDGGLLPVAVERQTMILAPAERAEILVDLSDAPRSLLLESLPFSDSVNPLINVAQAIFLTPNDERQGFKILELRTSGAPKPPLPLPTSLGPIERWSEASAVRTREFTLDPRARTINNLEMDMARIDQVVRRGDLEIWVIRNQSVSYHRSTCTERSSRFSIGTVVPRHPMSSAGRIRSTCFRPKPSGSCCASIATRAGGNHTCFTATSSSMRTWE